LPEDNEFLPAEIEMLPAENYFLPAETELLPAANHFLPAETLCCNKVLPCRNYPDRFSLSK
jgi:hypothetical protein